MRLRAPMMRIHTVAAGGGSICAFDGARFRVGPESAGANPGPASYRRGGPLTVTDCNVMVGKLDPALFPHVFGPNGDEPLDAAIVRAKFAALAADVGGEPGTPRTPEEVADGFLKIAVANMANAIKHISVERGYDVTEYTLCCFGGAGGQHACLVADALGMTRVLLHPLAGVLSAYGMGLADVRALRQQAVEARADRGDARRRAAGARARSRRRRATRSRRRASRRRAHRGARARCTSSTKAPTRRSRSRSATIAGDRRRVRAQVPAAVRLPDAGQAARDRGHRGRGGRPHARRDRCAARRSRRARLRSRRCGRTGSTPTARCAMLPSTTATRCVPATRIAGPAVIREDNATTVVEPGWRASFTDARRPRARARRAGAAHARDRHRPPTRCCSRSSTTCSWRSPSRWA